jgi:hypothetical protein
MQARIAGYRSAPEILPEGKTLADYHDNTLIFYLKKALRPGIVDTIANATRVPDAYHEYKQKALNIGSNQEERWEEKRMNGPQTPKKPENPKSNLTMGGQGVPASAYSAGGGQGAPMQVDRAKTREAERTGNQCFYCKKPWGSNPSCPRCKGKGMLARAQTTDDPNKLVNSPTAGRDNNNNDNNSRKGFQEGTQ